MGLLFRERYFFLLGKRRRRASIVYAGLAHGGFENVSSARDAPIKFMNRDFLPGQRFNSICAHFRFLHRKFQATLKMMGRTGRKRWNGGPKSP